MFHRIAVWRVFVTLDFSTFSTKSPIPDLHSAEAGCPAWGGKRSLAPPHFDELVGVGEINDTSAKIAFTRRGQRE
jgi:hypothetical protein